MWKVHIACDIVDLGPNAAPDDIRSTLALLCSDETMHGVILQTPLPAAVKLEDLASAITPEKDIDGANPLSLGRLAAGLPAFAPATAEAVLALLDHHNIELTGRHIAVIGRSTVVGKPVAHLLLNHNATVTVYHSRTKDLPALTSIADVVVAAVGRAGLITAEHVRPGSVVVDVGTNPTDDGRLVGDVDAVTEKAGALTPVPGGVGPVTTALLLQHTVQAATEERVSTRSSSLSPGCSPTWRSHRRPGPRYGDISGSKLSQIPRYVSISGGISRRATGSTDREPRVVSNDS